MQRFAASRGSWATSFVASCGMLVGVLLITAVPLFGTANSTVSVTIQCDALKGKSGVPLRILQATALGVVQLPSNAGAEFDSAGVCRVDLEPGEYVFETSHVDGDSFIALRTPARRITPGATISFETAEPLQLTLKNRNVTDLRLSKLAIRSAATTGEVVWSGNSSSPPQLVLSPGESYRVRAIGDNGSTYFAVWQEISTKKPELVLEGERVCKCRFNVRSDGPEIKKAAVRFQFPDDEMRFEVNEQTVFLTNRRFLSFGYGLELANGRRVLLRPWLGMVKPNQEFQLGGPFTPAAWAKVMLRKPVGGPETRHLVWGANLYDARGHMVLTDESQIDWRDQIRSKNGAEVPTREALTKEDAVKFLASGDSLLVDVSYMLDRRVNVTLVPERFRQFGSRRFHTTAPPQWELQAINYLDRAERVFHIIEDLENKPSKHRVEVRWHAMKGAAWGCAPAGGNAHIIMPFSGLRGSFNYYDSPWALAHEMLHTFGYGHGDKMNFMSNLAGKRFEQYRWFMADHPEQDPGTAFQAFRLATHIDRREHPDQLTPQSITKLKSLNNSKAKKKKK